MLLPLAGLSLREEALLQAARRATGRVDFGDDGFRRPLSRLLGSLRREAQLSARGRILLQQDCLHHLCNRLLIQDALARWPGVAQTPVASPWIIISLPRTGSTLLHNLLAQHSLLRAPRLWELWHPTPCADSERARRIARTRRVVRAIKWLAPGLMAAHPLDACAPEESGFLLKNAFASYMYGLTASVPEYIKHLADCDMSEACRYYRLQLQLMQMGQPTVPWVLKSPEHAFFPEALLKAFPDARVVRLHRSPLEVVASFCRLMEGVRGVFSRKTDPVQIGRDALTWLGLAARRMAGMDEHVSPHRATDIAYAELVRDPVGTAMRAIERLGNEPSENTRNAMAEWLAAPRRPPASVPAPLEKYGLTEERVREMFEPYTQRFEHLLQAGSGRGGR